MPNNKKFTDLKRKVDAREFALHRYGIELDAKGWGRCPFTDNHNNGDANPSLQLHEDRLTCWSQKCLERADLFDLVQRMDNLSIDGAIEVVAEYAGSTHELSATDPQRASVVGGDQQTEEGAGEGPRLISASYEYRDLNGDIVYTIKRIEGVGIAKEFRVHPARVSKDKRVLYRLPELVASESTIVVVEGEKCADILAQLGHMATTSPFGSGAWQESYAETLRGRDVVMWPDADRAGARYAEAVLESIEGVAASLSCVTVPSYLLAGGDVADVYETHGSEEVDRLLAEAEPWSRQETVSSPTPIGPVSGRDRPRIIAGNADLSEIIDMTWKAIEGYNDPPNLLRYGTVPVVVEMIDGEVGMRQLSADAMLETLSRAAKWFRRKKDEEYDAYPPPAVARAMLAGDLERLPQLRGISRAPTMVSSGTIVDQEGYDSETGMWYSPGVVLPSVPEQPNADQIRSAVELFTEDLLVDFPFAEDADRANCLALCLLPLARELIDGPTPLHLVMKPAPGSGATLLLETLGILAGGTAPAILTEGSNEDEWRKRITSTLLRSPDIIVIDNLRRRLDSSALSAVLTSKVWEDRLLGRSENVRLPNRCVWAATGNNPGVSNEIARRSVSIRIDPKSERPWERDGFRHPQLQVWVHKHRTELLHAGITLLRAWFVAGKPSGTESLGSYERWASVMGGILTVAGVDGFLENRAKFYGRADRESAQWGGFVEAWWKEFGEEEVFSKDLWALLEFVDPPCELGNGGEQSRRIHFGDALSKGVDRRFSLSSGTVQIEAAGKKQRASVYRLANADE